MPLQNNFDFNAGTTGHAWRYTLNVEPVIPIKLNQEFTLIMPNDSAFCLPGRIIPRPT
ncbi:MAG: hypothetical protein QM706_18095 [Nitrospira sp.]